jgi:tetratricopeptide (TPR) repeat protein
MFKKNKKEIVFGSLFFIFNIMFLLQILGAGQGYLADRFTYIAYIGLFFIAAHYFQYYYDKYVDYRSTLLSCCGIYLMALAFLSYRQGRFWKNSDTMWSRVIEYYDNTPLPFNNRANYLRDLKNFDAALQDYNKAISLRAGHATYNSRAKLFFIKNEDQKALLDYNKAIEMSPTNAEYYVNRGAAYAKLGRLDDAINDFNKGLSINPNWKVGYLNRSIMYNQLGNFSAALADINKYLQFEPKDADLWYEGGRCLRALNQNQKAAEYYSRSISLKPKTGLFYRERGIAYKLLGKREESLRDLNMARQLGEIIEPALMQ